MLVDTEIVGGVPVAGGLSVTDGFLVFLRHILDEAVLFAGPKRTGSMARRKNDRLDAFRLAVNDIGNSLHGTPRLAEEMDLVKVQVLPQGDEFVDPRFLSPEFGMAVEVGVAAADLVVGNHLTTRVGNTVQYLEIVVCAARSAMQQHQCGFV